MYILIERVCLLCGVCVGVARRAFSSRLVIKPNLSSPNILDLNN